jgi:hypothetical protein
MNRLAGFLASVLLAGCAADAPSADDALPPANPFARPAGASRNLAVGQLTPGSARESWRLIALSPGHPLRGAEFVVTRNAELRATALLKVTKIEGRVALADILRGQPGPRDEVVLPSTDLTEAAQALPGRLPGS